MFNEFYYKKTILAN